MKNTKKIKSFLFSPSVSKFAFIFCFLVIFSFTIGVIDAEAQCAMCRATVETNYNNGNGQASTRLNTGILYLLCMPYLLIGTVGFLWYRNYKKNKNHGKRTLTITSSHSM